MNSVYDTGNIPPIDNISRVQISLGTEDRGTFVIDMQNLHPGQVEIEQRISSEYSFAFDIAKRIELMLRCRPTECTFTYHPPCEPREIEDPGDSEELMRFLSSFERRDDNADET